MFAHLSAEQAKHHVWRPDVLGSICFLVASALAIAATTHRDRLWDPEARNWWNSWLNMLGSVAFGVSAYAAKVVDASGELRNVAAVNLGTFLGALCFLVAALLVLPPREVPAAQPPISSVVADGWPPRRGCPGTSSVRGEAGPGGS